MNTLLNYFNKNTTKTTHTNDNTNNDKQNADKNKTKSTSSIISILRSFISNSTFNKSKHNNTNNSNTSPHIKSKENPIIESVFEDVEENLNNAILANDTVCDYEADPSTSKNIYNKHLKPIRPTLKEIGEKKSKRFTQGMYNTYSWLEYSKITNKIYCFVCRMFHNDSLKRIGILII
jgi:hypothetical protein